MTPRAPSSYRPARVLSTTRVELVTGPPGSGKTTRVRNAMCRGEIIIDLDAIWMALTGLAADDRPAGTLPAILAARDAIVDALARSHSVPGVWIISCAPTRKDRARAVYPYCRARLTVLAVPAAECIRRTCSRGGARWEALIRQWWQRYQQPGAEEGWDQVEGAHLA